MWIILGVIATGTTSSPVDTITTADVSVKKLQAFFAQTESLRKEAVFRYVWNLS